MTWARTATGAFLGYSEQCTVEDLGSLQGQQTLLSVPRTFLPLLLPSLLGYLSWSLNLGDLIFLIQVKMVGVPSHNKAICVVGPVD